MLPVNDVLIEGEQDNSERDQGFVKACDVKPEVVDMMDKAVSNVGHLHIFTNFPFYLVRAEEESRSSCVGAVEAYQLFTVFGRG